MCKSKLSEFSVIDLILEFQNRGLLTNAKSNQEIINNLHKNDNLSLILTRGLPNEKMECRECRNSLDSKLFTYYLSRVDQKGYLMRTNALCYQCSTKSNQERKKVFDNSNIPPKPKKGDKCPNCDRKWLGNWHRHHEGDKFIKWLCGHCNMSFSDQRNTIKIL
jgi:hypothetical protein